ncbi:MAG: leucine-rich repeat domain-containing protein [Ruminococcaceae bacterium]|nr:leucine-rich repeat domain-containing protein [Oscillospiraceae bacterium]
MDFLIEDGVLEKYLGSKSVVVVPDGVHCIGRAAFQNCQSIKNVIVPKSVSLIGEWAFAGCESLECVQIIGNAVLKKGSFYKCANLKELIAPNGLSEIEDSAFVGCKSLHSDLLSAITFELHTVVSMHNDVTYPNDEDICIKAYPWKEYQKITAMTLDYALIYSTEKYNELERPEIPTLWKKSKPISDDLILVKDSSFAGCLVEEERIYMYDYKNPHMRLAIVRLDGKAIRIRSRDGNNLPFDMYEKTDVILKKHCENAHWSRSVNSILKTVLS